MPARARAQLAASGLAAGNGTVMRATPIGLAARDVRQAADAARRDAELTHADPVTGLASAALCAALLAIRHGGDPLQAAREQAAGHERLSAATQAAGRDERSLARLSAEAGACWTTLALALHALVTHGDYERGVSWVIGCGGDADSARDPSDTPAGGCARVLACAPHHVATLSTVSPWRSAEACQPASTDARRSIPAPAESSATSANRRPDAWAVLRG
jgi:poly(ADP-ribose) glycohydrolase ARH3